MCQCTVLLFVHRTTCKQVGIYCNTNSNTTTCSITCHPNGHILLSVTDHFYVQAHCAHVTCDSEQVTVTFYSATLNVRQSGVLTALFGCLHCCHLSTHSMDTIQPCTNVIQSQACRVHVWLAVTCHLHLWQNNRDLLWATMNRWNKSQVRRLTLEKNVFPLLLHQLDPMTFQTQV